jgi:CubicO group peptidase (beta-lactamase class C family)
MRLATIFIAAVMCIMLSVSAYAQTWLDTYIDSVMQEIYAPGLTAKVVKNGEIAWSEDYGWADVYDSIPAMETTVFGIASTSKTCTSIALMQLREDGLIQLDDNINDYLPFQVIHPEFPDSIITFYMLMTHTASVTDDWDVLVDLITWGWDSPIPLGQFLEDYLIPGGGYYSPSHFQSGVPPGTSYQYTNVGTCLAGYIVEAITGIDYDEYCRNNIFEPLGMYETSHFYAQLDVDNIAIPYHYVGNSYIPWGYYNVPWYPSSSLKTSSLQMSYYMRAIMQYGYFNGNRILDSTTVSEILTPWIVFGDTAGQGFFMFYLDKPGVGRIWGHHGAWNGVTAYMFFCPAINSGVIALSNGESYEDIYSITDVLWEFALSYMPLVCAMTPLDPPIVIPFEGGSFDFSIDIDNPTDSTAMFDFWTDITLLSGDMSETLILLEDINLLPGELYSDQLTQTIEQVLPSGEYSYNCYVGEYPQYAWKQDSFAFTKEEEVSIDGDESIPLSYVLYPAYPNPFNASTLIRYDLPYQSQVIINIYDILGRQVGTIQDVLRPAGHHQVIWNADELPSGVYFYRIQASGYYKTRKLVLLK